MEAKAKRHLQEGMKDASVWNFFREQPADCIGGPKQTSFVPFKRRRDQQHKEMVQTVLNRKMATLRPTGASPNR